MSEEAKVVLPATPELVMSGMKRQLTTRILECTGGGFIVVFEGKGVAARSNWGEVLDAICEAGVEHLDAERPDPIPEAIHPDNAPSIRDRVHAWIAIAAIAGSLMVSVFSVKLT